MNHTEAHTHSVSNSGFYIAYQGKTNRLVKNTEGNIQKKLTANQFRVKRVIKGTQRVARKNRLSKTDKRNL